MLHNGNPTGRNNPLTSIKTKHLDIADQRAKPVQDNETKKNNSLAQETEGMDIQSYTKFGDFWFRAPCRCGRKRR